MKKTEIEFTATMTLPKGGKQAWSNIMYGETPVPNDLNVGSPIVMATAHFENGTWVAGGVYKSSTPTDYNIIFMWVFDKNGKQYPGWPIDVSDNEDFFMNSIQFGLEDDLDDGNYLLKIVEAVEEEIIDEKQLDISSQKS